MGDLLGPLMLQFEYLNKQKMPSQEEFLARLGDFISGCTDLTVRESRPRPDRYGTGLSSPRMKSWLS